MADEQQDVARRNIKVRDKALLPFPTEFTIALAPGTSQDVVTNRVQKEMSGLAVHWIYDPRTISGLCFASENVWSRSARRKRRKPDDNGSIPMEIGSSGKKVKTTASDDNIAMSTAPLPPATATLLPNTVTQQDAPHIPESGLRISAEETANDYDDDIRAAAKLGVRITVEAERVRVEWLKGLDSVLWESFCGILKRAIDTAVVGGGGDGGEERPGHI